MASALTPYGHPRWRGAHTAGPETPSTRRGGNSNPYSFFEAGCDDAILGVRNGVAYLEFDRPAATLPAAVLDAIRDVEAIDGIDVVRVEPDDLVSASEIAVERGAPERASGNSPGG